VKVNEKVRSFWEEEACGTSPDLINATEYQSKEWYDEVESYRYSVEPFIHSIAQFTRHDGKRVLEIGVGAGTDHLNWAKANTDLYGVDLTDTAIETTKRRLDVYGLKSNLQRTDAEKLPFQDNFFDVVYSWGVIHHSEDISKIISEISRVLKPGGKFLGMIYNRRALHTFNLWIKHALLTGKLWRSLKYVLYHFNESIATKAYTKKETQFLFNDFKSCEVTHFICEADLRFLKFFRSLLPSKLGFYLGVEAINKD
jgi:ubiquinone/menaquinone biosynthesis C-methylase UbiE